MRLCASTGEAIALRQILPDAQILSSQDIPLRGCRCNPREVKPGDLFVLVQPEGPDREPALEQALTRGCAAVVSDRPLPGLSVPVVYVADAREAFGRIVHALAGYPSQKLNVIGVTGALGKTTAALLITRVLFQAGYQPGMLTTLGYFEGEESSFPKETTPPAHELAASLARMVDSACTHAVVEVSPKALRENFTAGTEFDAVVVLNTDDPLQDRSARDQWFQLLDGLKPEGFAVLNSDDGGCRARLARVEQPTLTIGLNSAAEIQGWEISRFLGEEVFYIIAGGESFPLRTRLFGRHHITHCLAAAAVGLVYQIPLETIVKALESVDQIPGRLQPVLAGQPFSVFVDAAESLAALKNTLETVRPLVQGRLICVVNPPRQRDGEAGAVLEILNQTADLAVLTRPGHGESSSVPLNQWAKQVRNNSRFVVVPERMEAIGWALTQARPEDCVLLLGNGHRLWRATAEVGLMVDDYRFARQWLRNEFPD